MITTYSLLKTVHILAAVIWLGGAIMLTILAVRARRAADPQGLVRIFRDVAFIAPRTFVPASLVLVATGFWMVADAGLPYETWVVLAIVGWAVTFVTGIAVLTPQTKRAEALLDEHGATSELALAQVRRVLVLARIDAVVLTLVVVDMVIKPA